MLGAASEAGGEPQSQGYERIRLFIINGGHRHSLNGFCEGRLIEKTPISHAATIIGILGLEGRRVTAISHPCVAQALRVVAPWPSLCLAPDLPRGARSGAEIASPVMWRGGRGRESEAWGDFGN